MRSRNFRYIGFVVLLAGIGAALLLSRTPRIQTGERSTVSQPLPVSQTNSEDRPSGFSTSPPGVADVGYHIDSDEEPQCMPFGAVERRQLEDVASAWYAELGDPKQRKYWPYQSLDERILEDMAAQGDAEAMLQLGLNKLWRATRVSGSKWPMNPGQVVADMRRREQIDTDMFTSAEVDLHNAAVHGKVFALRQLLREYEYDPEPILKILHPQDSMPQEDAINAFIASYHLLENYLVDSRITSVDSPLSNEARKRAERYAKSRLEAHRFFRQEAGFATEKVVVPDAVLSLMADDTCQR